MKVLPCPSCGEAVDLFSTYVFASHAYAAQNPTCMSFALMRGDLSRARVTPVTSAARNARRPLTWKVGPAGRS